MDGNSYAKFGVALALSLGLTGCLPAKGTLTPQDKLSVATMALEAGATLAELGKAQVLLAGSYPGCIVMEIVVATLSSASEATLGAALDTPVLPKISVDLSDCLALADKWPEGKDAAAEVKKISDLYVVPVTNIVLSQIEKSSKIKCRDAAIIKAAFGYSTQALGPILEEIASPDGKFEIPQMALDLSKCTE